VDQESIEPGTAPGPGLMRDPSHAAAPDAGRKGRGRNVAVELVQTLVLTLVIFFVIQTFVAQPFQVQQHSMERTFQEGDYVLVDRLTPRWSPYGRGQVIVFQAPAEWVTRPEPFIKRVIGVAGDTVEIRDDGTVAVNGTVLDEPYLYRDDAGAIEPTIASDEASWAVPNGELFVMGDHRQASEDSRVFGPIPVSSVIGRGMLRYWPLSDLGIIATPAYDAIPAP
jgi:signal peptidase I